MAEGKKSFVLYADLKHTVSKMPNDKAGELFKHILLYVNDENPITDDLIIQLTFEPIKQQLKRDLAKYEDKRKQWSEAGKRSAEVRKAKKNERTLTTVKNVATDLTVNDSVNVNDNVIEEEKPTSIDLVKTTEQIKQIEIIYETFINEIKEGYHSQWAESSYMSLKIKKGSLTPLLKDFKHQLIKMNKLHKNTLEVRQHFDNWLNKLDSIGKLNQYKTVKIGAL